MRRSIYRQLAHSLLQDCREMLDRFEAGDDNVEVFAFALDCDPFNGDLALCINTNPGYREVARKHRAAAQIDDGRGLHGLRYRSDAFAFRWTYWSEATLQFLDEIAATQHDAKTDRTAERHATLLLNTLTQVVLMLESSLEKLATTPDFIAYVTEFRATEKARIDLLRKTVVAEDFDAVFPEVHAFAQELAALAGRDPEEQARFWGDALRGSLAGGTNPMVRRLGEVGVTEADMLASLRALGSRAVPVTIGLIDDLLRAPQRAGKGAKAAQSQRKPSPEVRLAEALIEQLVTVRLVDEASTDRLQRILRRVVKAEKASGGAPMAYPLADLLHVVRPHRFPPAKRRGTGGGLENARDFGVR